MTTTDGTLSTPFIANDDPESLTESTVPAPSDIIARYKKLKENSSTSSITSETSELLEASNGDPQEAAGIVADTGLCVDNDDASNQTGRTNLSPVSERKSQLYFCVIPSICKQLLHSYIVLNG